MIAIIDYGAGNLRSVSRAVALQTPDFLVTQDPAEVERAAAVPLRHGTLPGLGQENGTLSHIAGTIQSADGATRRGRLIRGALRPPAGMRDKRAETQGKQPRKGQAQTKKSQPKAR